MTTFSPPPETPATPPEDPYSNKAIAAALTTLVTLAVQWAASGELSLDQEGITALGGALTTVLVWAVSNRKRAGA